MKIFTTALIAFGTLTYGLTAHATYHSIAPEYPTGRWSLAVIGCAHDWINSPPHDNDMYSATVIEVTVASDKSGHLEAHADRLIDIYMADLNPGWQAHSITPSVPQDYNGQAPFDYSNFGAAMWDDQPALVRLNTATVIVTSASQLENTPGDHTRAVTVELTGVDPGDCSIRTSNLIRP